MSEYRDYSESNQEKKRKLKEDFYTYAVTKDKNYARSIARKKQMAKEMKRNDIAQNLQIINPSDESHSLKCTQSWKQTHTNIKESFTTWRSKHEAFHFLCCSLTANNGQSQVMNKLLQECGVQDSFVLPETRQVLQINSLDTPILINMISTPMHYAKEIDGFNRVDGIIYIVNPMNFAENSSLVYEHLHDILGEFHYMDMSVWIILNQDENLQVSGCFEAQQTSYQHSNELNCIGKISPYGEEIAKSLKLDALHTCGWYSSGWVVISSTENLTEALKEFVKGACMHEVKDLDSGNEIYEKQQEEKKKKKDCVQS
jgi:hypothetical protein